MTTNTYDLIIIGAGPAGMTAALYALRAKMNVLLLDRGGFGGQALIIDAIDNFPSYETGGNGFDWVEQLEKQLKKFRLVVILPSKDKETVILGNKLHPRFLSYTFGNFSVVKTVLKKYFSNAHPTVLPQLPKDNQSQHQNCLCKEKNYLARNFQGDLLNLI